MNISSKLNELESIDLNCNVFDVYNYDGLSMQELLCQFFTKINECIKVSNETIDLASWLVNEGLKIEVVNKLMMWLDDGTLDNLINVNIFNNLNTKIDNISTQIEHIENDNNIRSVIVYPNGVDDSENLNTIINDNDVITLANGTFYISNDILIKNDKHIKFSPKTLLKKIAKNNPSYSILCVDGSNVIIENACIIGDREESNGNGEWGNGIEIGVNARNVRIIKPNISNCFGDGIYIGSSNGGSGIKNITIEYPICFNNRRNGISITEGENIKIIEPSCNNQNGVNPQSGIDIEPNSVYSILKNIRIIGGEYKNNVGNGLVLCIEALKNAVNDVSVIVNNPYLENNNLCVYDKPNIKGFIEINNPIVQGASINLQRCYSSGIEKIINNPKVYDFARNISSISPQYCSGILIGSASSQTIEGDLGNIFINNPIIEAVKSNLYGAILIGDYTGGNTIKNIAIKNLVSKNCRADLTLSDGIILKNVNITSSNKNEINSFNVMNPILTFLNNDITGSNSFNSWVNFANYPIGFEVEFNNLNISECNIRFGSNTSPVAHTISHLSPISSIYGIKSVEYGSKIKIKKVDVGKLIITELVGNWTAN